MSKTRRTGQDSVAHPLLDALRSALGGDWTSQRAAPGFREGDEIAATLKEIDERLRALENENRVLKNALQTADDKYRRLKANIPGVVYVFELQPDGSISFPYMSDNCLDMFGVEPADAVRDENFLMSRITPEDALRVKDAIRESAATMRPFRFEVRFCRDGDWGWADIISRPEKQPDGTVLWDGIIFDITERKRPEEAVQTSELKYRALYESMMDAYARVDLAGRYVKANQAFCDLVGYKEDELLGMHKSMLSPERWHERDHIHHDEQAMVRGYSDVYEKEYRRKDGTLIPVELRIFMTRDEQGRPSGAWAIVRDITERKRAEQALLLTQACFDHAAVGIHRIGPNLEIEYANEYFCRSLGYTQDEIVRLRIPDIDDSVDDEWMKEHRRLINITNVRTFETQHRRKDGTKFPVQLTVSQIMHLGKRYVFGFAVDIAERRQFEEALRGSEAKYRQLHETMIDAFVRVSLQGDFLEANKAFCELVGYSPEELKSLTFWDLTPDKWHQAEADLVREQLFRVDYTDVYEKEYRRKDGTVVPVELRSFLMRDADGEPSDMWAIVRDISERKRVERALRLTQFCFEKAAIGIIRVEADRRFVEANEEFCRMVGYSHEELLTMLVTDVCEVATEEWMKKHRDSLRTSGVRRFEVEFRRKDGSCFPMAVTTCLIVYEGKEHVYSFCVDITERVRAERDLLLKRDAMDNSLNGFSILNSQFLLVYVNKAYLRMWGYDSVEEILGTSPATHVADPDSFKQIVREMRETGACSEEFVARRKDGSTFDALASARQSVDADGDVVYVASLVDITERKRQEEALRLSEERLRLALAAGNQAVYDIDTRTGVGAVSDSFATSLGYSPEEFEISIEKWKTWLHPDDRGYAAQVYEDCIKEKLPEYALEYRLRTKDGSWKWFHSQGKVAAWDADGKPLRLIGTHADITERKAVEEERARLEAQLNQARKMESVGRLAGGVAHDFNNMLTVILGYAELIKSEFGEEHPLLPYINEIERAANRSRDVTSQLLAFSRKQFIVPMPLDLNAAISVAQKSLLHLIGEDIALRLHLAEDLWRIKFDVSQVDQILVNLCVNARDAMPNGGTLLIETSNEHCDEVYCLDHVEAIPGRYVRLQVSDDGAGMDPDTLSHIFEPFFTTKEVGKGTGLGLATIYGIVKQNGGFVNVYSEVGRGTTFMIHFPSLEGETESAEEGADESSPTGAGTILLVEDDAMVREMTESMLRSLGYSVVSCVAPNEALVWCKDSTNHVDLLMTDVVMPGMNGRQLRDAVELLRPGTKVLFFSGYTANVVLHHGVLDEGVNYLQKPFSRSKLAQKVRDSMLAS